MAAGSDKQVVLDLLLRDQTGKGSDSASDNLNDVADAADKASKSTDKLGKTMDANERRFANMDHNIARVKQNLVFLHASMGDVATEAERIDIGKAIRKAEGELGRLVKSRKALTDILPDPEPAARSFARKMGDGITDGLAGISGKLGQSAGPTVGAAIGIAAAPVLTATLGSALAAGAGAGVIGVGIAAAVAGDRKIQEAGQSAGARFMQGLQVAAGRALGGRTLGILADLEDAGQRVTAKLGTAFSKLGPYVRPFVKDITAAGEAVAGSLITAAGNSGPALQGLGQSVRIVGKGVADFIKIVSDGGPEAANNLRLLAGVTADVLRQTGLVIRAFNELSGNAWVTGPWMQLLSKHYKDAAEKQKQVADSAPDAAAGMENMAQVAQEMAPPLRTAADALKDIVSANQDLFESSGDVEEAMDKVTESIKENGQTISIHTVKGRANRDALSDLATQMNRNYQATLKVNGEGPKTDAVAKSNTANFVKLATQMTGSRQKAIELANKLLAIPDVRRKVVIDGLSAAKTVARRIKETLAAIKDEHVNVIYNSGKSSSELRAAFNKNAYAREYGGPVKKGHAYIVGERRPEVFVPDRDGRVVPSLERYARMGGQASTAGAAAWRPSGGGTIRIITAGGGEGKLAELINYLFRNGMIAAVPG